MATTPEIIIEVDGAELPERAKAMGITGLWGEGDRWLARFEKYGSAIFQLPLPVVQWLMEEG